MENLEIFAKRVKELRKQSRLSQVELGEVLGLTHKSTSTIESGLRSTTILAKFFEDSTGYLLRLRDEP